MDLVGRLLMNAGTWGGVAELRHVLPRVLEGTAADTLWTDPELTICSIGRAESAGFTDDERAALAGRVAAWWPRFSGDPDALPEEVDEVRTVLRALGLIDSADPLG